MIDCPLTLFWIIWPCSQVSCNAHMGEDIITAMELQDIGDDAKVCPAFAPAW